MFFLHAPHKQYINSFTPKYKQGQNVYIEVGGKKKRVEIHGAKLNRYGSFVAWVVYCNGIESFKKDPECPWNLLGEIKVMHGVGRPAQTVSFIKDFAN